MSWRFRQLIMYETRLHSALVSANNASYHELRKTIETYKNQDKKRVEKKHVRTNN